MKPLIVTLAMDEAAFEWFDALRRRWFPAGRNLVPAHVTLFHHLPGAEIEAVRDALRAGCARTGPFALEVQGPWSLGRGVAYRLGGSRLSELRSALARTFEPWLKPQDRQPFRPHITVQNKVEPAEARALLTELQHAFEPFEVTAEGVQLWRYLDGPWEAVDRLPFTG